jgi:hypothetical protein
MLEIEIKAVSSRLKGAIPTYGNAVTDYKTIPENSLIHTLVYYPDTFRGVHCLDCKNHKPGYICLKCKAEIHAEAGYVDVTRAGDFIGRYELDGAER